MASIKKRPDGKYRARYRDDADREHARHFDRKFDAQQWLDEQTASVVTGQMRRPAGRPADVQELLRGLVGAAGLGAGTRGDDLAAGSATFAAVPLRIRRSHVEAWVKSMTVTARSGHDPRRASTTCVRCCGRGADRLIASIRRRCDVAGDATG